MIKKNSNWNGKLTQCFKSSHVTLCPQAMHQYLINFIGLNEKSIILSHEIVSSCFYAIKFFLNR